MLHFISILMSGISSAVLMKKLIWIVFALGLFSCQAASVPPADFPPTVAVTGFPIAPVTATNVPTAATLALSPASAPASMAVQVVYIKDGNLWLWESGSTKALTSSSVDSAPLLSGDGSLIFFLRQGHLWVIDVLGTNPRQLDELAAPLEVSQYVLLPGTHRLFFNTQIRAESGQPAPTNDLFLADSDSPPARRLLQEGEGGLVTLSPDGQWLALAQPEKINVVHSDGSGLATVLTFPRVATGSSSPFLPPVAWLSNSYGFKTIIPAAEGRGVARFLFVAAQGGDPAQLALINAAPVSTEQGFFLSPDSDRVAYLREAAGNLEVHVIDAATADQTFFTGNIGQLGLIGWAPDGSSLVCWVGNRSNLNLLRADGSLQPLNGDFPGAQVVWLDAGHFLFVSGNELRLGEPGKNSLVIDSGKITEFSGLGVR